MPIFFHTSGPNEVMVVSGLCHSKPRFVISGGKAVVCPCVHKVQRIKLNIMTIRVDTPLVYTKQGVSLSVNGVAQVKIQSSNKEMLESAVTQFLGKSQREIITIAKETLEGHQRAMLGQMTVEEVFQDRHKFSEAVFETASKDFVNLGVSIVSYVLTDIRDNFGYLEALGKARTAQVKRDAAVGEAEAARDAGVKRARGQQVRIAAEMENKSIVAKAERDYLLKQATYDGEVNSKRAQAELAYPLQVAKTRQAIKQEEMQIKVVERRRQIEVQDEEISRKEKQLDAEVRKPADARKFEMETLAEAEKNRTIWEARAEAESVKVRGDAEAFAIEVKAKAEAEMMAKKADAWKEYQDAAMVDMVLGTLPKVIAEVAAPLSQAKRVVMVSSNGGELGVSKLTGEILQTVTMLPGTVKQMTGVDISQALAGTRK